MILETIRRVLSICFLVSILAAKGLSRIHGSEYAGKTVKNEYGDTYDCIDFYKQRAFDHPLLKTHSFHPRMRPTFQPETVRMNDVSWKINATATDIPLLKDGGCPHGTVPIRRMSKSGGISGTHVHPQRSSKVKILNTKNGDISGTMFAISQTTSNIWKVYNGVGAVMSVYNPRVLPSQYSSAEIILKGGTDSIIAGWTVNPQKYRDSKTRFFIYASAGDMHCFDSECGFVLVRSDLPLDFVLKPVSNVGGDTYVNKFFIYRNIFKGLQESATYAACGGEVFTPGSLQPPEMGTGYMPQQWSDDGLYCREFVVVDDKNTIVTAESTEAYANNDAYAVVDQDFRPSHYVLFGGPTPGVVG